MGNLQVRFLEGWAPAMAPGYSTAQPRASWPLIGPDAVVDMAGREVVSPEILSAHEALAHSDADIGSRTVGRRAGQQMEGGGWTPRRVIVRAAEHWVRVIAVEILVCSRLVRS